MEYVRFNVDLLDNKEYKFLKARAMKYLNNNKNLSIYVSDNSYEK